MARENIAVVIPALNEEETIAGVVSRAVRFSDAVIVVDDKSADNTAAEARKAGATVLSNKKNLGYEASLGKGMRKAIAEKCTVAVTLDADNQHFPEDIPRFVELVSEKGADIVVGIRKRKQRVSEKLFGIYFKRFGTNDPLCGFKAYNLEFVKETGFFDSIDSIGTELVVMAALSGKKVMQLPIKTRKRADSPRLGTGIMPNVRFLLALLRIISKYGFKKSLKK